MLLATQFPGLFDSVHKKLGELTGSVVESTKTAALSCLSQVAKRIAKRAKFVTALCRHLITAALEGTPRQAKFAVLAYLDMGRPAEPLLTALVSEDSLTTDNVNLVSVLKVSRALVGTPGVAFTVGSCSRPCRRLLSCKRRCSWNTLLKWPHLCVMKC